ncbi:MAG: hypothetical protein MJE12_07015 [Alphaproteobacteria bacterium]|nr:hypothetical protein [Alphaproteobacteria bacterium]
MSGFEALMAGRTDPFGALLPPMAKPPAAGPRPDRAASGNILTGGVTGGGTVEPPPRLPEHAAPATLPTISTLNRAPRSRNTNARLGAAHSRRPARAAGV